MPSSQQRAAVTLAQMRKYGSLKTSYTLSEQELTKLSPRLKDVTVHSISADMTLRYIEVEHGILLEGTLSATVTQTCVISLQPIPVEMKETFSLKFVPKDKYESTLETEQDEGVSHYKFSLNDSVEVLPLEQETVRFFDLLSDQLILNLDPYPRAKNAIFSGYTITVDGQGDSTPESDDEIDENPPLSPPPVEKKKLKIVPSASDQTFSGEETHKPFAALSKIQLTKDTKED